MAMRLDGKIELVAGAFSSNPEKSKLSGEDLFLDPKRVYADYRTMAAEEAKLPVGERIDFVSVVTPNRTHVPRIYRRGNDYLSDFTRRFTRVPAGHPEAFIEAFANIYLEVARAIEAVLDGQPVPSDCDFPTVDDGVNGMAFIATAVKSAKAGGVWTKLAEAKS